MKLKLLILILLLGVLFSGCNTEKFKKIPTENFIGLWEIQGREMFNGIQIKVEKTEDNKLKGRVVKLNNNKYVKMLVELDDLWVTEIKRSSNFQFILTEKIIGSDIFNLYGLKTTKTFNVQFINNKKIGLDVGSKDPSKSNMIYIRIE